MPNEYDRAFTVYRGKPASMALPWDTNTGGAFVGPRADTVLIFGELPAGLEFRNGHITKVERLPAKTSVTSVPATIKGTATAPSGIYSLKFSLRGRIWIGISGGVIQENPPSTFDPIDYDVTITVVDDSPGSSDPGSQSPGDPSSVDDTLLTWFQARAEARAGARIRRAEWVDRWLEFNRGFWWLQRFNPVSKAAGERRIVQVGEWSVDDFRAVDFTLEGIPGQPASAGSVYQSVDPSLRYP